MKIRDLRNLNPDISQHIIVGCSSLAGLFTPCGDDGAYSVIQKCLELGLTRFDTAPHYGCGLGEERLGKCLALAAAATSSIAGDATSSKRYFVYTKVGRLMLKKPCDKEDEDEGGEGREDMDIDKGNVPGSPSCIFPEAPLDVIPCFDYTAKGVRQSFHDSRDRFGTCAGYISGLRLHDCDSNHHINQAIKEGGISELVRLRDTEKLIVDVSIGTNNPSAAKYILDAAPPGSFNSLLLANSWNLIDHPISTQELLMQCHDQSILFQNAGIFASGLLVGGEHYLYSKNIPEAVQSKVMKWKTLCAELDIPLGCAALAFSLLFDGIDSVVIGVATAEQVIQCVQWFHLIRERDLTPLWSRAKLEGLFEEHLSPLF